jgi:hypothetical protein
LRGGLEQQQISRMNAAGDTFVAAREKKRPQAGQTSALRTSRHQFFGTRPHFASPAGGRQLS